MTRRYKTKFKACYNVTTVEPEAKPNQPCKGLFLLRSTSLIRLSSPALFNLIRANEGKKSPVSWSGSQKLLKRSIKSKNYFWLISHARLPSAEACNNYLMWYFSYYKAVAAAAAAEAVEASKKS